MASITVEMDYEASAETVWKRLRDFGGVASWMPGVAACDLEGEGIGAVRSIQMGSMTIQERLESFDDRGRSFAYSIANGPMPVQNYLATVTVSERGSGCHVDWSARFDLPEGVPADALRKGLEGAYGGALAALKKQLDPA